LSWFLWHHFFYGRRAIKRKELGKKAEQVAASYLRAHGYRIEAINWRDKAFEVDIVARRDKRISFIEVKSSSSKIMGPPQLRVTKTKQKRIAFAAYQYLASIKDEVDEVSFDIIAIYWPREGMPQIEHIESAFTVDAM
jgi:putative endonuclease